MKFDLLVAHGTVVTEKGAFCADIGIRDGKIVEIAEGLLGARDVIDAKDRLVLPGGIDSHVHIEQPGVPGIIMGETFESGTRSAAWGGNTTVLPFCLQQKGQSLRSALIQYHERARGRCFCDVSFHLIVSDLTPQVLGQELPALLRDGYNSVKVFMTYEDLALTDYEIMEVMSVARDAGALVMVHAENFDAIRFHDDQFEREGKTEPLYHARSRPIPAEREATHRAIALAEMVGVPIMIVHVSNGEAIEEIARAKRRGQPVFSETCPQYLLLKESDLLGNVLEAAKYVCSPPPRDEASQIACWEGVCNGMFEVFSSDHCPYRFDETGKLTPGAKRGYKWIPNGIPGIETRLPLLFSEGVVKGRISLERFVDLSATMPAKLYGLYPQKGSIMVGADADIAIWDPKLTKPIAQTDLHHGCDYTPYEGIVVTGWPLTTIVRGQPVVKDRKLVGRPDWGCHLKRGDAGPALLVQ